jgi:hypothetical protein
VFKYVRGEVAAVAIGFAVADRSALERLPGVLNQRLATSLRRPGLVHRARATAIAARDGNLLAVEIACRPDRLAAAVAALRVEVDRLRELDWDRAVIATVMPPLASPEAARRTRGRVRRLKARR